LTFNPNHRNLVHIQLDTNILNGRQVFNADNAIIEEVMLNMQLVEQLLDGEHYYLCFVVGYFFFGFHVLYHNAKISKFIVVNVEY
jgi:hypothetical protein